MKNQKEPVTIRRVQGSDATVSFAYVEPISKRRVYTTSSFVAAKLFAVKHNGHVETRRGNYKVTV